ncbi:phage/plasmid replication protein, II/X family [Vibrio metschnikovii]|uniref:phage/plasmid replication protein, II/X family n=1 Tax=Vibrio metschnikovii TaxID=28172 RepID=UPI002FC89EDF
MYDFLGLRIHFKDAFTTCQQVGEDFHMSIDMEELAKRGLRLEGSIDSNEDGIAQVSNVRHPWDSIPSSYTGIAFKVYQASGFRPCACVELKASPAKVVQGHNVFGSDDLLTAAVFITTALKNALPEFSEMLDFNLIDVFRFDATHSVQLQSRDQLQGALESLTRVSHKYLRPSRQGEFESTVYFNSFKNNPNSGRTTSLCIYSKLDEVLHQLEDLKARKRRERTTIYDKVIDELSSDVLNDFATNRLRFEARFKARWFVKHDIPQNLWDFINYVKAFESQSGMSFCQWAWKDAMKDLLSAIEGSTLSVVHDHKVMSMLHDMYDTFDSKGKKRTSHALRLFQVYDRLKHSTYEQVKNTMSKSTFYRSVTDLMAIGLSKEQIQNLHKDEHLPLAQIITFDFDAQRPDYYQEPDLGGLDTAEKLRAYLTGDNVATISITEMDKIYDSLKSHNMPPLYARALQAGREVRLSQDTAVSFVMYQDGTHDLVYHPPGDKHSTLDLSPKSWISASQTH